MLEDPMWYKRPLDEKALTRLHRVWATHIGGCPRAQQYWIHDVPMLPSHYISYRGTLVHKIAEQLIHDPDATPHIEPTAFHPTLHDQILYDLQPYIANLRTWLRTTEIDLSEAETEVKYEMDLGDGFTGVRKVDILTPEWNIDLKSGTFTGKTQKGDRLALAMGYEMIMYAGEGGRRNLLVYLGKKGPGEVLPFVGRGRVTLQKTLDTLHAEIDKLKQMRRRIAGGELMMLYTGYLCQFQQCRAVCRGI